MKFGLEASADKEFMYPLVRGEDVGTGTGLQWFCVYEARIVLIHNHQVVVSTGGGDGETAGLIGANLTCYMMNIHVDGVGPLG